MNSYNQTSKLFKFYNNKGQRCGVLETISYPTTYFESKDENGTNTYCIEYCPHEETLMESSDDEQIDVKKSAI